MTDGDCSGGGGMGRRTRRGVVTRRGRQTGLNPFASGPTVVGGGGALGALGTLATRSVQDERCMLHGIHPCTLSAAEPFGLARRALACVLCRCRRMRRLRLVTTRCSSKQSSLSSPQPRPPAPRQRRASIPRCNARPYCPKTLWIAGRGRHRTVLYNHRQQLPSQRNIARSAGSLP